MNDISDISEIKNKLKGTNEAVILEEMEKAYAEINKSQSEWYERKTLFCPDGCGNCCINFEPDLLEGEALYMAAWLLQNEKETALKVSKGSFPFDNGKTCPFFNAENSYHCSIYGGRPCICRFFGGCGFHEKNGTTVWKPCKFLPEKILKEHKPELCHRQYSQTEVKNLFGSLPPVTSDFMEQIEEICPDETETKLLREILPQAIQRLLWLCKMNENNQ